jgi:hypothetical protein
LSVIDGILPAMRLALSTTLGIVLVFAGCSGASDAATPLGASSALGRVADVAEVACVETRATLPLAADATITACRVDADCTEGRNGRCLRLSNHGGIGPSLEATMCSYDACFRDADCGSPLAACYCGNRTDTDPGMGHSCSVGDCATDADCGADHYCRRGPNGRRCHSPADTCVEETECGPGLQCTRGASGVWACEAHTSPLG